MTKNIKIENCKKCGNEIQTEIIIKTTEYNIERYLKYKESNEGLCFECFLKVKREYIVFECQSPCGGAICDPCTINTGGDIGQKEVINTKCLFYKNKQAIWKGIYEFKQ